LPNDQLLIAAYRASQFSDVPKSSTFNELATTGRFDLLAKSNLNGIAKVYYENPNVELIQVDGRNSEYQKPYRTTL
jgi:hypothetical protein